MPPILQKDRADLVGLWHGGDRSSQYCMYSQSFFTTHCTHAYLKEVYLMRLSIPIKFGCLCSSYFRTTIFPNLPICSAQMFFMISLCQTPLNGTCLLSALSLLWTCIIILGLSSSLSCVHKRHFLGFHLCRGSCLVSKFVQVLRIKVEIQASIVCCVCVVTLCTGTGGW